MKNKFVDLNPFLASKLATPVVSVLLASQQSRLKKHGGVLC